MQCQQFEQILIEHTAGGLPAAATAHLSDCGRCRAMVSDLEAIQTAARELVTDEVQPPERLWQSLRAQLKSEGLIRESRETHGRLGWWSRWWEAVPRPALAGAYLSFLLAAAVLIGLESNMRQNPTGLPADASGTATLHSQLENLKVKTISAMHQHDPVVAASMRQNLDIVDNFVRLCEKSVREDPRNQLAREYLYGAYQQKAELLAAMVDRGAMGD